MLVAMYSVSGYVQCYTVLVAKYSVRLCTVLVALYSVSGFVQC